MTGDVTGSPVLRLVDAAVVRDTGDRVHLDLGTRSLAFTSHIEDVRRLLGRLSGPGVREGAEVGGPIVRILAERGYVTTEPRAVMGGPEGRQYGYLSLFGPDAAAQQDRVRRARVAVIGVGGIGGIVAQHLVGAGVRSLDLVDGDCFEESNLNRQFLGGRADLGRPKVEVVADALDRMRADLAITTHQVFVDSAADLPFDGRDLLVVAADRPRDIDRICWAWCAATDTPFITGGVGLGYGYWGPTLVPGDDCLGCWDAARLAELTAVQRRSFSDRQDPTPYSFGPSNTVISGLVAHEAVRFLAVGATPSRTARWYLNFDTGATTSIVTRQETPCGEHTVRVPAC